MGPPPQTYNPSHAHSRTGTISDTSSPASPSPSPSSACSFFHVVGVFTFPPTSSHLSASQFAHVHNSTYILIYLGLVIRSKSPSNFHRSPAIFDKTWRPSYIAKPEIPWVTELAMQPLQHVGERIWRRCAVDSPPSGDELV
ncbi:hypothetical protein CVT26_005637 [Gymnopilus dilepis]|uniref:Uncharacterized protein n=1 Tax=Gymnopilus dilepis TaxID=231916 RepID=A0A409XZV0_9AGAR|nr:hypothetical protein CVT26_005637 [Gymnopilus dilepis]